MVANNHHEKIQKLVATYTDQLPEKIGKINEAFLKLLKTWTATEAISLQTLLHNLSGSAGTYGYPKISNASKKLELLLKEAIPHQHFLSQQHLDLALDELKNSYQTLTTPIPGQNDLSTQIANESNLIYLLIEKKTPQNFSEVLTNFGYQVKTYTEFAKFHEDINRNPPILLIVNEHQLTSEDEIELTQIKRNYRLPLIFFAAEDSFASRLKAVRMGGSAFFVPPVDIIELSKNIDLLCGKEVSDPYRILIVEDSLMIAEFNATILEGAGMKTEIVNNPLNIMAKLIDFKPDLILIDVYMPGCSGLEVATLLRQQPAYTSVPIVFLSAEEDKPTQLLALSIGAEDFITKDITPGNLIANIKLRVKRARILRSYMIKDSLTDLYNHTALQEKLKIEIDRAKRRNSTLAFVMLDLDNFKKVNDLYGHTQGDKILKEIASLLQRRLRKTDIAARYGGEEFAIVLPDTTFEQAEKLLNEIRNTFASLQHQINNQTYHVTFSAGIASYPPHEIQEDLINTADKALYEAKNSGKNKVVYL